MRILVVNGGSSTLKADIIDTVSGERAISVRVERIGEYRAQMRVDGGDVHHIDARDHGAALAAALPHLTAHDGIDGVGHRVVHGGAAFSAPVLVDDAVQAAIEDLIPLAPLHNPANLAGIQNLKEYMASEIGVKDGEMIVESKGLHLYGYAEDLAKLRCLRE